MLYYCLEPIIMAHVLYYFLDWHISLYIMIIYEFIYYDPYLILLIHLNHLKTCFPLYPFTNPIVHKKVRTTTPPTPH